ncbi:MAG: carbohydrate ABC transporter permease [Thiotrichales bacterium]|nr:carbohydrate ABC transporter permease [Thiotrichales bacterium]
MNVHRRARLVRTVALMVVASALLVVWVLPLIWAFVVSLKSEREVLAYPPNVVFDATWSNYVDSLFGDFSIIDGLLTSAIVSTATTVLTILLAVPAAYAFARLRLPAKRSLGFYTLATQMVPPVGLVIPYFLILNRFGWLDTYHGMIVVYLTFSLPFAIWLMVSYMEDIPREMEEAAFLDRASRLQTLWHIIIPQVRGGIAVTVIFIFLNAWNEFLFAVQLGGNTVRPVTVEMYNFVSVEQTLWAKLSAAALVAMLPVVVIGIAAQKQIVKGLTVGAVKGGARQ